MILGLDLSLNATGVAILPALGSKNVTFTHSSKQEGSLYERIRFIERFVQSQVEVAHPEVIGIEAPIVGAQMTEMAWAIHILVLRLIQETHPCFVVCPPNTSVKSIVFRSMDVSKTLSRDKAKAELGIMGKFSADEADAYFVAKVAARFYQLFTRQIFQRDLDDKEAHVYLTTELNSKGQRKGMIFREGDLFYDWRLVKNAPQ